MILPLGLRPISYMDTETTGLTPGVHEVIEIAIRKECPLTGRRTLYHELIRPEHIENAEPKALACNGYANDPSAWANAWTIRDAAPSLLTFLDGTVIVGHNVNYDVAMINGVLMRAGIIGKLAHHKIDTVTLCFEHLVPLGLESLRMDSVRDFLGWSRDGAHRALKDIEDLERLYKLLHRMGWWGRFKIRIGRLLRRGAR